MRYLKRFEAVDQRELQKHIYREKGRIGDRLSKLFSFIDGGEIYKNGKYRSKNGYILISGIKPCNLIFNKGQEFTFDLLVEWFKKEGWIDPSGYNHLSKIYFKKIPNEINTNHQYTLTIPNEYIDDFLDSVDKLRNDKQFIEKILMDREMKKFNL